MAYRGTIESVFEERPMHQPSISPGEFYSSGVPNSQPTTDWESRMDDPAYASTIRESYKTVEDSLRASSHQPNIGGVEKILKQVSSFGIAAVKKISAPYFTRLGYR